MERRRLTQRTALPMLAGLLLTLGLGALALEPTPGQETAAPSASIPGRAPVSTTSFSLPHTTTTPTSSPQPPPELAGLIGRPPSPVALDPVDCALPLIPGALAPTDWTAWNPGGVRPATQLTDAEIRAEISTIMRRRFRLADPERAVAEAIALYDSRTLHAATGGDRALRAALAELKGTLGEPVLRYALTTHGILRIGFGDVTLPGAEAEASRVGPALRITVSSAARNDRPALLAPLVFHELLHQRGGAQFPEELTATALDVRVALEQLRDFPEATASRTEWARSVRWSSLAQLNTRSGGQMTLTRSDTANVLPGSDGAAVPTLEAWLDQPGEFDLYAGLDADATSGHATLTDVLTSLTPGVAPPQPVAFDEATIDFLDANAGVGLCDQLVAARALGVVPAGADVGAVDAYLASLPAG